MNKFYKKKEKVYSLIDFDMYLLLWGYDKIEKYMMR